MTANDESGDVILTLRVLTNSPDKYELTAFGTEGIMQIDLRQTPGIYIDRTTGLSPKVVIKNFLNEGTQLTGNFLDLVLSKARETIGEGNDTKQNHTGHYRIIDEFVEAVENNGRVPVTLEEGLDTIRLIEELENATPEGST